MITLTREEAQSVLDALSGCREDSEELFYDYKQKYGEHYKPQRITFQQSVLDQSAQAIETLRTRLSAPEPEPVAWMYNSMGDTRFAKNLDTPGMHKDESVPLYTAPPQREWQGLTDEEKNEITWGKTVYEILDLAEAKLKEKNA
jgi:hypothetical protein